MVKLITEQIENVRLNEDGPVSDVENSHLMRLMGFYASKSQEMVDAIQVMVKILQDIPIAGAVSEIEPMETTEETPCSDKSTQTLIGMAAESRNLDTEDACHMGSISTELPSCSVYMVNSLLSGLKQLQSDVACLQACQGLILLDMDELISCGKDVVG